MSESNPLLAMMVFAALLAGCRPAAAPSIDADASTGTVTVEINTGDSVETIQVEGVAAGSTVESVMRSIDEVAVTINGSGTTAFLDSLAGKSTTGSEGWTYRVNGEFASRGIGDTTVIPPATVTWTFGGASEFADDQPDE